MKKLADRIIFMHQSKGANDALDSVICLFKDIKDEVMTRAEIIDILIQYQIILNEEFKINKP